MKTKKFRKSSKTRLGKIETNNVILEEAERKTILLLKEFGFNIEVIRPVNTPKTENPDVLISGTIWEIKTPTTHNLKTIKKRLHKASLQSSCIIFDLRFVKKNQQEIKTYILKQFSNKPRIRKIILITSDNDLVEFSK